MADILVSGIVTEEVTGVLLISTSKSNPIHSHEQKRRQKMKFHAIHWYNQ